MVPMVVGGFASTASYVPGAYSNFSLASVSVDRRIHTDPAGKTNLEESWEFKGDGGDAIQLQLRFDRGIAARSKIETTPYSAVKPDFIESTELNRPQMSCAALLPVPIEPEIHVQGHWREIVPVV